MLRPRSQHSLGLMDCSDIAVVVIYTPALRPRCVLSILMCSISPYGANRGFNVSSVTSLGTYK